MGASTSQQVSDEYSVDPSTKRAVFIFGGCGAGKNTLAEKLMKKTLNKRAYTLLDSDIEKTKHPKWHELTSNWNQALNNEIHINALKSRDAHLEEAIQKKKDFVFVGTGRDKSHFIQLIKRLKKEGFYVKVFHIDTNEDVCVKRAKDREQNTGRRVEDHVIRSSVTDSKNNFEQSYKTLAHTSRTYENNTKLVFKNKLKNDWSGLEKVKKS